MPSSRHMWLLVLGFLSATCVRSWNYTAPAKETDWKPGKWWAGFETPRQEWNVQVYPDQSQNPEAYYIKPPRNNWSLQKSRRKSSSYVAVQHNYCTDQSIPECCPSECADDFPVTTWFNFQRCLKALPSYCSMTAQAIIHRKEDTLCVYNGYDDWAPTYLFKLPTEISRLMIPWRKFYIQAHNTTVGTACHFPFRNRDEFKDFKVALSFWPANATLESDGDRWGSCSYGRSHRTEWMDLKPWEINQDYYSHGYLWFSIDRLWKHAFGNSSWAQPFRPSYSLGLHVKFPGHCKQMEHWENVTTMMDYKLVSWAKGQNYTWYETNRSRAVYDYGHPLTWGKTYNIEDFAQRRLLSDQALDKLFFGPVDNHPAGWVTTGVGITCAVFAGILLIHFAGK